MRYLKLFENYEIEKIEDILLPFIDDKKCFLSKSASMYKIYTFYDRYDLAMAINRLKNFNAKKENYILNNLNLTILDFDSKYYRNN